ncbi:universal stress protein [Sedimenticola selenatireducens]|uniref:Universal stress protein, UspA n=1 Tax=Sedimenticola selenatireducens TaxID=191960 RepID=A0A558DW01_9GAMM|nr:universal stress protein [Sedimenticola selenatireducens]TVO77920.1 universal stress protein, UspA [Sedimenticola selenatireducens]TVT65225.1 MAG: universal stress protein, UspA [Sedimenticola selenatireducens]
MNRFKNILCIIEKNRESCCRALERAVSLAKNNQANLTVVDVVDKMTVGIGMPDAGPISIDLQATINQAHQLALEKRVAPFRKQLAIQTKLLVGTPFLEIIREVLKNNYDLVVKTPLRQSWVDRLLCSDDMHLLRKCPCPVWLIKSQAPKSYKRILAAIDTEEDKPDDEQVSEHALNKQILDMAGSLALSDFAELNIVHVWHPIGESALRGAFMNTEEEKITAYVEQVRGQHAKALDQNVKEMVDQLGDSATDFLKPKKHLIKGWPSKEIPLLAKEIDAELVIMGTVGRTGIPGFIMGNTAETILNQIDCSVLAVKPPGFVTPVQLVD